MIVDPFTLLDWIPGIRFHFLLSAAAIASTWLAFSLLDACRNIRKKRISMPRSELTRQSEWKRRQESKRLTAYEYAGANPAREP